MVSTQLKRTVEALLFASDKPISSTKIRSAIGDDDIPVEEIVEQLNEQYSGTDRAFFIMEVAGGYQLVTHKEFEPYIKQLYVSSSRMRLSQAALETLSIIAYKQPVSRPDIDAIRGVNSDGVLRTLLERDLIVVKGREEQPGRPLLYGTSDEFLRYFGLKSLKDMPKLREVDDLMQSEEELSVMTETESVPEGENETDRAIE